MEQPCYKCGQVLDEGRPFCPHCGAPQIRVVVSEPTPVAATVAGSVPLEHIERPATETVPVLAVPVRLSDALKPCALAAGVGVLLMVLGLTPVVSMFSVGFLAVIFYRQGHPGVAIKAGNGARLGAFGGLMCFGVVAAITAIATSVPELRTKFREQILAQKWVASRPADPQFQAALEQMKTPEGFVMMLIMAGVLLLVLSIVLGVLGGALGGGIFGRRDQG